MDNNSSWVEKYYQETDQEEREEILEAGLAEEGMTLANEFRKKLWDYRYIPTKKEKGEVDHFFKGIFTMDSLARTKKSFFNSRYIDKEIESLKTIWAMDLAEEYGELGWELLYAELKQMARSYILICQDDKNFSTMILGVGKLSKNTLTEKIADRVYQLAVTIPKMHNFEETAALFSKALIEAYFEIYTKKSDRKRLQDRLDGVIVEE